MGTELTELLRAALPVLGCLAAFALARLLDFRRLKGELREAYRVHQEQRRHIGQLEAAGGALRARVPTNHDSSREWDRVTRQILWYRQPTKCRRCNDGFYGFPDRHHGKSCQFRTG